MNGQPSYCFLINTLSNASKAGTFILEHENIIKKRFPDAELVFIKHEDSIAEISALKSKQYTHIVACGGDGTVNQVVNGIMGTHVTLGVIPLGSGNDFANSLGMSKNFEKNLSILEKGKTKCIDVVENESGYFVNTFGMGLDGLTNYHASKSLFNRGMWRYFWGGLKALFQAKPFELSVIIPEFSSPLRYRCWMITLANGKNEGGRYTISPSSCNYDRKLEIIIVKDITRLRLVFEFLKLSSGLPFNKNIVDVFVTKNGCKTTSNREVKSHADGEQVYTTKINNFNLLPGAINVIVDD